MSAFALDWGVLWVCWESWSTISESTHQWITLYKWCFLISNRFLEVGWLNPRVNAHMVWLGMPTPFSIGDGPSYTPTSIWDVFASHIALQWTVLLTSWNVGVCYLIFVSHCYFSLPDWKYTGCTITGEPFEGKYWFWDLQGLFHRWNSLVCHHFPYSSKHRSSGK